MLTHVCDRLRRAGECREEWEKMLNAECAALICPREHTCPPERPGPISARMKEESAVERGDEGLLTRRPVFEKHSAPG